MRNYLTILRLLRSSICVGACLLWTVPANAVQPYTPVHPDPVLEAWRWSSYPELNGKGLHSVVEGEPGQMWLGIEKGVVHYDGVRWTHYDSGDGLLGDLVWSLCRAADGRVFAGTELGVSVFEEGRWRPILPPNGNFPFPVQDLEPSPDGSILAGTS
jgi:hypothetical protein